LLGDCLNSSPVSFTSANKGSLSYRLLFIVANFIELKNSGKGTNIIVMGNDGFHRTVTIVLIYLRYPKYRIGNKSPEAAFVESVIAPAIPPGVFSDIYFRCQSRIRIYHCMVAIQYFIHHTSNNLL